MSKLRISAQEGRALALALIVLAVGCLLIPPFLAHISTSLLATEATEEGLKEQYGADAGVENALWQLVSGGLEVSEGEPAAALPEFTINNKIVNVTVENEGDGIYKITSIATSADGGSTTIVSYVRIADSNSDDSSAFAAFGYAIGSLDGDIDLGGSSMVYSDNYPELDGNVYATGDVNLSGSAQVYGDATATGTVNTSGSSYIHGERAEGADPLVGPDVDTQAYKAEAQDVECAVCGDYTYTGINWDPDPGVYEDPVHAKNNMTINGNGTWTFKETVCAGVDTNKDLDISGSVEVTFEGPVKVGGELKVNSSDTVIFKSTVCVGQDLKISSSGNVIFEGPVYIEEGDNNISGSNLLEFGGTVYVQGDLKATGSRDIPLGGTVYVCGDIDMSGSGIRGGSTVIAEGQIDLTGSAKLASEDIPFVIALHTSTGDSPADAAVKFSGSGWTSAIVYAPNGHIRLTGSNKVRGALVGKSVDIVGSVEIEYPIELGDREHWPDVVGGDEEGGELGILTYNINP